MRPVAPLLLLLACASARTSSSAATPTHTDDPALSTTTIDAQVEREILEHLHSIVYDASVAQLADTKGYDLYVLAQSWQPEFCKGKEKVYPGCVSPQPFWRDHFTLHGLWPERESGAPPGFCEGEPFDADAIEQEIGLDVLKEYWPDVKFSDESPQYPDFWKHEWTRHGTCSGLAQVTYFASAVNLVRNGTATTPALVSEHVGKDVALVDLRKAFTVAPSGATAVLKCMRGGDTLSQVFTCWSKGSDNHPVARRPCPVHVLNEDTCSRAKIHIPAFP